MAATQYTGWVLDVVPEPLGSALSEALTYDQVAAGISVLPVGDALDFDQAGGILDLGGTKLAYTAVDYDADTVTLAAPLDPALAAQPSQSTDPDTGLPISDPGGLEEGTTLTCWDVENDAPLTVLVCYVRLGGEGADDDPVPCTVSHALVPLLSTGMRDGVGETVLVENVGAQWRVVDVLAKQAVIDGSTIINLPPPPEGSDGLPPGSSPTPVVYSGLGTLQARWNGIENADPVTYRVYLSTHDQHPPDPASMIDETTDTMVVLTTDADGNRLVYGVPYYVSIQAFDDDGAAPPSPVVSGTAMQATNDDVSSEFVYAGQVIANQIIGGEVTSPLVLSSSIKTGQSGARVEILGDGIAVYDSTGTPVALIPTQGTAIFRGDAEIGDLTLVGGATLRGSTEVSRSAYIVLADKVSPSRSAPSLSNTWDSHPTNLVIPDSSQGDADLEELPASWFDTDRWALRGVVTDDAYARNTWWGQYTNQYGNIQSLLFTSLAIEEIYSDPGNPLAARFEGDVYEDEILAATFSGDAPAETGTSEDGYYIVTRYSGKTYLQWAPLGYFHDTDSGTPRIRKECRAPNVGNYKWAATNQLVGSTRYARIYGAERLSNGTVSLNRWDPNSSSVMMVSIDDPGSESNWDSKWGRVGGAAGSGALVDTGNYLRLTSTGAGNCGYSYGEKQDVPCNAGDRVTVFHNVWPATSTTRGERVYLQIFWWNSAGGNISVTQSSTVLPTTSQWSSLTVEGTAPAGTVRMSVRMYWVSAGSGEVMDAGDLVVWKSGGLDSPVETLTLNTGAAISELLGITVAKGDLADTRILVLERTGSLAHVRSFSLTGARQASEDFPLPTTGIASLYWNENTSWWESVDHNGVTYKHEPGTKNYDKLYASFTWRKGTQYESAQSAVATINNKRRAKLVINIPPKVITGAADDPDSAGIYLGQGASTPARTGMHLQATINGTSLVVTAPTFAAINPPDPANNPKDFPSAIPGRVYSTVADNAGPLVDLKGDGSWRLGNLTGLSSGVANGQGRIQAGVSTYRATPTGTAPGPILGQEATPTVWSNSILRGFTYANGAWTCQPGAAGTYLVWAKVSWLGDTANDWSCGLQIWKNGVQMGGIGDITVHPKAISNSNGPVLLAPIEIAVGDQMAMSTWQNSGTARTPNGVQFYLTPQLS